MKVSRRTFRILELCLVRLFSPSLLDPDPEVCLHVLRLLQSVILEPEVLAKSAAKIRDTMPLSRILMLSKCRNGDLQVLAQELLEDIKVLECEI